MNKTCMIKCQDKLYPLFDEKGGLSEFVDTEGHSISYDSRIPVKEGEEPILEEVEGKHIIKFGKNHEYRIPLESANGEYYSQMKHENGGTINIPFPWQQGFKVEHTTEQNDVWSARMKNVMKKFSK